MGLEVGMLLISGHPWNILEPYEYESQGTITVFFLILWFIWSQNLSKCLQSQKYQEKKLAILLCSCYGSFFVCKILLLKQVYTKKSPKNQSDGPQQNHQKISGPRHSIWPSYHRWSSWSSSDCLQTSRGNGKTFRQLEAIERTRISNRVAIYQHLQRGAKWLLKAVNSPSLRV